MIGVQIGVGVVVGHDDVVDALAGELRGRGRVSGTRESALLMPCTW